MLFYKLIFVIFLLLDLHALNLEKPSTYKNQNINGWLMSEKLDGIRAYWNGKELLTKNGNKIFTPDDFTKNFPPFKLDGELWTKRDDFENIQNIVLDKTPSKNWSQITYNIFEVPYEKGDFNQRLNIAKNWFKNNPNKYIKFIPQIKCFDNNHLNQYLEKLVSLKAEGIIIKNPNLSYVKGRSNNSFKVKKFYDMEGEVIGINFENNKFKSLVLKLKDGVIFNLGNGFKEDTLLPKVKDIVTFKYYGFTKNGKPKFASFLRVRKIE